SYQNSFLNPHGSSRREGLLAGIPFPDYQDPKFSFDGIQLPMPWLDALISSIGQSQHAASAGFYSSICHATNLPSGRNLPHLMNLHQARQTSGMGQSFGFMSRMYPNNLTYGHYGNTYRPGPGFGSFGYDSWKMRRGWSVVENKYKPRGRSNGKENMARFNELNKGPRNKDSKNQEESGPITLAAKTLNLPLSENSKEDNLVPIPDKEQYNRDDFPENYSDAKFFIIKSYSEDDVHISIKYNVWTSTPNGNKKLDAAYKEAKEKPDGCPVFLLFSVNTSGQFVGLAEMVGPVDFNKTVGYWQQDKWVGCFPVKWHIIKDIPNSLLRHILLEYNENKPVTNSRDTQEVKLEQGIEILKIFKGHPSKTCVLDDFVFYESRQKSMQETKAKQQQSQKQVLDGKCDDSIVTDHNDKNVIAGDENVQKTADGVQANGDVKLLEDYNSPAAVANDPTSSKPLVSSEKRVVANGVASAC
ncbi:YTH domain-containing protein, partial [Cephalotus follicularis]